MIVYLLSVTFLVLCTIHCWFKYNGETRALRKIPGPKDIFLLGHALTIIGSPEALFALGRRYAQTYEGIYSWFTLRMNIVNIFNPDDIETVVSTTKHTDKSPVYIIMKPWLGEGLLLSNGSKWLNRRKVLTPAFHFNILKQFFVIIEDNSRQLVRNLEKNQNQPIDVIPVLSEYTLNSICESAMGTRLRDEAHGAGNNYKQAVYALGKLCVERLTKVYLISDLTYYISPLARKTKKYLHIVHSFSRNVINERKKYIERFGIKFSENMEDETGVYLGGGKKKKTAMLDLLLLSEKEGSIDSAGVQEEVDTFMFEGHDTTASGLNFCLMLLANHKYVQDKILAELDGIFGDSTCPATMEDLSMMRYLECCIKESLRLYPPVHFIGRKLTEDTVLGDNYALKAGTYCHIHIYDLHRREDIYKNAQVFDPDRFLTENCITRHPYAYIPFSAGPRNCIGQKFALMEMKSCVAAILRNFELHPVTHPSEITLKADVVLRPTAPIYVKFVKRNK